MGVTRERLQLLCRGGPKRSNYLKRPKLVKGPAKLSYKKNNNVPSQLTIFNFFCVRSGLGVSQVPSLLHGGEKMAGKERT